MASAGIKIDSSVVLIGTAGPAQKLTAQLWLGGNIVAYVKFANSPTGLARIAQEHTVLAKLPRSAGPSVLAFGDFEDGRALVTAPVKGRVSLPQLQPSDRTTDFLDGLPRYDFRAVEQHPFAVRLANLSATLTEPWLAALRERKWPIVFQHGDFAPWNVFDTGSGSITAIDWEYGCEEGFPHVDTATWVLQVGALVKRWSPRRTRNYAARILSQKVTAGEAASIVRLTAYHLHQQALEDGIGADTPLQRWRQSVWSAE